MTLPLFGRRRKTFTVNQPEPVYDVTYLGNVPTTIARGEGCVDRPLNVIWRNYEAREKKYPSMKLSVTPCGLKATTEKQGVNEYWSHRIVYCIAPAKPGRIFCWIYKHEGRRLKPELRCHAVLFKRSPQARRVAERLKECLVVALNDYKRDKMVRQRLRTSHSVTGLPSSVPLRRQLLYTGGQNFRPPLNRSKSAPKLYDIEEDTEEDDGVLVTDDERVNNMVLKCLQEEDEEDFDQETDISDSVYGDGPPSLADDLSELNLDHRLRLDSTESEPDTVSSESGFAEDKSFAEDQQLTAITTPECERKAAASRHDHYHSQRVVHHL